jgi:hypothetical protein
LNDPISWRLKHARAAIQYFPVRLRAWLAFKRRVASYQCLTEERLRATRKSDTVFIFGSGASLNDISPAEWTSIAAHDTMGFNWFVRQRFVRCDYHLVREMGSDDLDPASWRPVLEEYFDLARHNPHYADTVFLVQTGFRATNGNRAIGLGLLPAESAVFLWHSRRGRREPTTRLSDGLAHVHATLEDCVNFAFLMGWRAIVLTGIDLYDRRYFWLGPDEPIRGDVTTAGLHNTAKTEMIDLLGDWRERFLRSGVELSVYNPRSLLARRLPVWQRPVNEPRNPGTLEPRNPGTPEPRKAS